MKKSVCLAFAILLLAGCHTTKRVQRVQEVKTDPNRQLVEQVIAVQPTFQQMQAAKARFKIDYQQHSYNVSGTINILTDSAIVISLQPLLGIELYRMEILPQPGRPCGIQAKLRNVGADMERCTVTLEPFTNGPFCDTPEIVLSVMATISTSSALLLVLLSSPQAEKRNAMVPIRATPFQGDRRVWDCHAPLGLAMTWKKECLIIFHLYKHL